MALPKTYWALVALVAIQAGIIALPGGPYFPSEAAASFAVWGLALFFVGRRSQFAWWFSTVVWGWSVLGVAAFVFAFGVDRLDSAAWHLTILATFAALVSPSLRAYVRGPKQASQ